MPCLAQVAARAPTGATRSSGGYVVARITRQPPDCLGFHPQTVARGTTNPPSPVCKANKAFQGESIVGWQHGPDVQSAFPAARPPAGGRPPESGRRKTRRCNCGAGDTTDSAGASRAATRDALSAPGPHFFRFTAPELGQRKLPVFHFPACLTRNHGTFGRCCRLFCRVFFHVDAGEAGAAGGCRCPGRLDARFPRRSRISARA